jgi:hypothetical protein
MNRIFRLNIEDGQYVETQLEIEQTLNTFFNDLLEEPNLNRDRAIEHITQHVPSLVTWEKNNLLMSLVEMKELEEEVN